MGGTGGTGGGFGWSVDEHLLGNCSVPGTVAKIWGTRVPLSHKDISFFFSYFSEAGREREKKISPCCSTCLCIHGLILACALTGDRTYSFGVPGQRSNRVSHPARARPPSWSSFPKQSVHSHSHHATLCSHLTAQSWSDLTLLMHLCHLHTPKKNVCFPTSSPVVEVLRLINLCQPDELEMKSGFSVHFP